MATARTLGVIGVNRTAIDGCDGILDVTTLIECIGVDGHLHIMSLGNVERRTNSSWCRAPVLMNLKTARARSELLLDGLLHGAVALAQKAKIHGEVFYCFEHHLNIPHSGCYGCTIGAIRGAYTTTDKRSDSVTQCCICLLRRDVVHVAVDTSGRKDEVLARDGIGSRTRNQRGIDTRHNIGVTRLSDACDTAILDTHIGLDNAQHGVEDCHIGNNHIESTCLRGNGVGQCHAVAQSLASAIDHLIAIVAQVALNFYI